MRLLCATDLSSRADRALRRAALLAGGTGAELVLLTVAEADAARARAGLEAQAAALGLPASRLRVELGAPREVIPRVAAEEEAALVVLGAHERRPLRDLFGATTAGEVMRRGPAPVLMVARPAAGPHARVLAALDLSAPALGALQAARGLGLLAGAELLAFHAFDLPARGHMLLGDMPEEALSVQVAALEARARDALLAQLAGVAPEAAPVLEQGPPAQALRRAVDRLAPDLVVIGTRGHGALGRLVLGSVAEEALRTLPCDVLAVPPAG